MLSTEQKIMLDLYAGTGGASEAFRIDPQWRVIRIEKDLIFQDVPEMKIADVSYAFNFVADEQIELIWASFPCTEFSRLDQPWTRAKLPTNFQPDMTEALKTKEIINILNPRYYCIENVRGAIPYLTPIFGPPTYHIGPYWLWTNLPAIIPDVEWKPRSKANNMTGSVQRSAIPFELSSAVLAAASQPTLGDF